ncbi:hypothetical protein [Aquimarina sp. I32.4]|uniref:hypothetical protein n=1 Tax=Aquimarina sp. I32.4 TaxID=2053903 RepID=UPI000CDEF14C|nr:hypothetical protein [Aquimarina sp. I32.4]
MGNFERNKEYTFAVDSLPINWLDYSEELKETAELIFSDAGWEINRFPSTDKTIRLERAYFLNYGFSIENLLKGLLIAENYELISNGKISPEISTKHDLVQLSEKVESIDFNEKEIELLKTLSEAIPYWGRYPIPKKFTKVTPIFLLSDKVNESLKNLWNKIGSELYNLIKYGWTGPNGIKQGAYLSSIFEDKYNEALEEFNTLMKNGTLEMGSVDMDKYSRKK